MKKVLSCGAGVNTVAILALMKMRRIPKADIVIFSDTGGELQETYDYIKKVIKPICRELNMPFIYLRPTVEGVQGLFNYCWGKKIFPYRRTRDCSAKFKVRPIIKFLRKYTDMDVVTLLGFEKGEERRAKGGVNIPEEYPLIEFGLDRKDCYEVIAEAGLYPPIKSGCFFCPFASPKWYKWLLDTHPDKFAEAERLEKQAQHYPRQTITSMSLEKIRMKHTGSEPTYLEEYSQDGCCAHCR